jgi:adenosylcobinamide kinase/adenosylcobinamide-phosphate guanylyltransferase
VVVVDCATLWLTNLLSQAKSDPDAALAAACAELDRLQAIDATWIFVSNELGMALHAATELGRKFVDLQGFVNQDIAARAVAVTLMVAGIPLEAKGGDMASALRKARAPR